MGITIYVLICIFAISSIIDASIEMQEEIIDNVMPEDDHYTMKGNYDDVEDRIMAGNTVSDYTLDVLLKDSLHAFDSEEQEDVIHLKKDRELSHNNNIIPDEDAVAHYIMNNDIQDVPDIMQEHSTASDTLGLDDNMDLLEKCSSFYVIFASKKPCVVYQAAYLPSLPVNVSGDLKDFYKDLPKTLPDAVCEILLCGDGNVAKGPFCGLGKCNMFGWNCDGGCTGGNREDAVDKFISKYDAGDIYKVL